MVVTVTDKTTKLTGYVRSGAQLATHGNVIVYPAESDQWSGYGLTPRRILSAAIATNGSYSASSLPAGQYFVVAVDDALATAWHDPAFLAAAAPLATRVTLEWDGTKAIDVTVKNIPGFRAGSTPQASGSPTTGRR